MLVRKGERDSGKRRKSRTEAELDKKGTLQGLHIKQQCEQYLVLQGREMPTRIRSFL